MAAQVAGKVGVGEDLLGALESPHGLGTDLERLGEAAGTAIALSLRHSIPPRKVDRVELQGALVAAGGNIGQNLREIPGLD